MKKIEIGKLEVSVYIAVECEKHHEGWDLTFKPVRKCPYYLALDKDDRTIFDKYVALIKKRPERREHKESYEYLINLCSAIEKDGRYIPENFKDEPMWVWKGTNILGEGHHRAAVLYYLFGPKYCIDVQVSNESPPTDHDRCSNPCKE